MNNNESTDSIYSGMGWKYDPATKELTLIFEAEGVGEDDNGNPMDAGVMIGLGELDYIPNEEICNEIVSEMQSNHIFGIDVKLTPITFEEYTSKGY